MHTDVHAAHDLEMKLGGLDFRRLYTNAILQIKEIFPSIRGVVVFPSSSKIVT